MSDPLTRRLAKLEGAEAALVLASGRAALACTVLALLRPGDHLLASDRLREETRAFFSGELGALGVAVTFVNSRDTRGWRRGLQKSTRALFLETPVLETGQPIDLKAPRSLAHELGIAFIVDATAATPVNFTPLAHGADVVLHDARVLLDGQGDGEAGVVCGTEGVVDEVRSKMLAWGAVPHPVVVGELTRALATLDVRVARQNANARHVAEWAGRTAGIRAVSYAGIESDTDHAVAVEWMRGAGPTLLLELTDAQLALTMAEHLSRQAGARSSERASAGASVTTQVRALSPDGTLRIQVGIEAPAAIVAGLEAALAQAIAVAADIASREHE